LTDAERLLKSEAKQKRRKAKISSDITTGK
jgi:hypothetical protein